MQNAGCGATTRGASYVELVVIQGALAVLLLLLGLAACSFNNQPRKAIAIVDVTVVDVPRGIGLPHRNVVLEGEKIASVAPAAEAVPNGASIISGKGRFLIPGLWDMHIHEADSPRALGLLLASGITGARDMATDPTIALDARRRIQEGAVEGPRLMVAGPALEGPPSPADDNTWIVHGPEEARKTVAKLVDLGVDFIKVHDHLSRESSRAVADAAKAKGVPFAGHVSEYNACGGIGSGTEEHRAF